MNKPNAGIINICNKIIWFGLILCIFMVPLLFLTMCNDVFETNKVMFFRVVTLLMLAAWATRAYFSQQIDLAKTPFDAPLLGYFLAALLATLFSIERYTSIFGQYENYFGLIVIAHYIIFFYFIVSEVKTMRRVYAVISVMILAAGLVTFYGILQRLDMDPVPWNPYSIIRTRNFSTLGNPVFLAAYLIMIVPVVAVMLIQTHRTVLKFLLGLSIGIMGLSILTTETRSSGFFFFLYLVGGVVFFVWDTVHRGTLLKENRKWLIMAVVLFVFFAVWPIFSSSMVALNQRFKQTMTYDGLTKIPRRYIWTAACEIIRDYPILGTGLDTFQIIFPEYRPLGYWKVEWNGTPEKAHNEFFQTATTSGLLGLGMVLWILAVLFTLGWRTMKKTREMEKKHLCFAFMVLVLAFLWQNCFSFTVVSLGMQFWTALGIIAVLSRIVANVPEAPLPKTHYILKFTKGFMTTGVYLVFLALVFFGFKYTWNFWTADAYHKLGNEFFSHGGEEYLRESMQLHQRAVELNPYMEIYRVKQGLTYERSALYIPNDRREFLQKAMDIYAETIRLNPYNGYNYSNLARAEKFYSEIFDRSKFSDAEVNYKKAISLDPNNAYFILDLASGYMSMNRMDEAYAYSKDCCDKYPQFAVPYAYEGYVAVVRKQTDQAINLLSESLYGDKDWYGNVYEQAHAHSNLGVAFMSKGQYPKCRDEFQAALAIDDGYEEGHLNLGLVYLKLHDTASALHEMEAVLKINPNNSTAKYYLKTLSKG